MNNKNEKRKQIQKIKSDKGLKVSLILLGVICASNVLARMPDNAEQIKESSMVSESSLSSEVTTSVQTAKQSEEGYIIDESLKGRGMADSGRSEPDYVNHLGYVVVSNDEELELEKNENFTDSSIWKIPTFEPDKQFWNKTDTYLPHKTKVVVLEQMLEHSGYGAYEGYLLVKKIDDGTQHYINVSNYVTKPYWNYQDNIRESALTGYFVAEYNQKSDYYPISGGGEKVVLENGKKVLVTKVSGTSRYVKPDENGILALVWGDWKYGHGAVDVYFNEEDLRILY